MKFSILHFTTITNLITLVVATDNGFVSSPLNPHQHHHGDEHNQSSHHHHMHDNNERSRDSNIIHHSSSSALYNPSNRFLTDRDHRKLQKCQGEGGGCKRKSCCSPFICIADVCGSESPPLTPPVSIIVLLAPYYVLHSVLVSLLFIFFSPWVCILTIYIFLPLFTPHSIYNTLVSLKYEYSPQSPTLQLPSQLMLP